MDSKELLFEIEYLEQQLRQPWVPACGREEIRNKLEQLYVHYAIALKQEQEEKETNERMDVP